jgi:hypothetical protein
LTESGFHQFERNRCGVPTERLIGLVNTTFEYFRSLAAYYQDAEAIDSIREVRDRMIWELSLLPDVPAASEVFSLCSRWRARRIELDGPPEYPPDMFIESLCEAIELAQPKES